MGKATSVSLPTLFLAITIISLFTSLLIFSKLQAVLDPVSATRSATRQESSSQNGAVSPITGTSPPKLQYHIIVSTGCSAFQDWQSYVFFYHVWKSGQEGEVTRIASGCKTKEIEAQMVETHRKLIQSMNPNFQLHITPDYTNLIPDIPFKYFNKCFGMQHWMKHKLKMPNPEQNNKVFVLLDPDQIVIRPFDDDYLHELWHSQRNFTTVTHGQPMAQLYGMGARFMDKMDWEFVLGGKDVESPLWTSTKKEMAKYYVTGPPYVATGLDFYHIVEKWAEFNIPIKKLTDKHDILSEMYGYMVATKHLNLPHQVALSFMVSDAGSAGEGWKWVDEMTPKQVCTLETPKDRTPHVLHFCQRYHAHKWFFSKYKMPTDILSCEHPLLSDPREDLSQNIYNYSITPDGQRNSLSPTISKRMNFMLCQILPRINQAALYYKQQHCDPKTANFEYSHTFH